MSSLTVASIGFACVFGNDLTQVRSLIISQASGSIPTPLLAILMLWLGIIFAEFGLLTANNLTVAATLFVCAVSLSGSIFLVVEMSRPLDGLIKLPIEPQFNALSHLGK